jgi:hypothetical protein
MVNFSALLEAPQSVKAIETLNLNSKEFQSETSTFRHTILLNILSNYFKGGFELNHYFNKEERLKWSSRHRQIQKQKKLHKFFGNQPTAELMQHQHNDDEHDQFSETEEYAVSLLSELFAEDGDKRKKAKKLAAFFGDQLSKRQMKRQNIIPGTPSEHSAEIYEDEHNELEFLETVNDLTANEKLILRKRVKKLLGMLGIDADSSMMAITKGRSNAPMEEETPSVTSARSLVSTEETSRSVQKQRLDKLSYVMGERITEEQLQGPEEFHVILRPLTLKEKKMYQKKNTKLERVFGNSVPACNVINYLVDSKDDDVSITASGCVTPSIQDAETPKDDEKKNQVLRLRKLKKMLGFNDTTFPLSDEAIKEIEEAIVKKVEDESDRRYLFEDLEKIQQESASMVLSMAKDLAQ